MAPRYTRVTGEMVVSQRLAVESRRLIDDVIALTHVLAL
jgi:hypothetical protein